MCMDELLELAYRKPRTIISELPIGAHVYFSTIDVRKVIGYLGKEMVYLQHQNGTQCLYNIKKDLRGKIVVKNPKPKPGMGVGLGKL